MGGGTVLVENICIWIALCDKCEALVVLNSRELKERQRCLSLLLFSQRTLESTVDSNVASECHLCCPSTLPGARQAEEPPRATRITPESIRIVSKQLMFFDLPGLSLSTTRGFSKKLGSTGSTRICEKFFGLNRSTPIFENKI